MNAGRSFWREVLVALGLSVVGALAFRGLQPWASSATLLRLLVLGLSVAYLVLTLKSLRLASGAFLVAGLWLLFAGMLVWLDPVLWVWLLSLSLLIWLARCLGRGASMIGAIADAGLCLLALLAAVAAARQTHSLFWALWSYFLVQALCVFLPGETTPRAGLNHSTSPDDRFDAARRGAEAALRRLATRS